MLVVARGGVSLHSCCCCVVAAEEGHHKQNVLTTVTDYPVSRTLQKTKTESLEHQNDDYHYQEESEEEIASCWLLVVSS